MAQITIKRPVVFCASVKPSGEWLLVERITPPDVGSWSIPGGHIEAGESPEEACIRELREETGARVVPEYKGSVDIYIPSRNFLRRCVYYVSPPAEGPVRGSSEGAAGWFRLGEKRVSPFLTLLRPWLRGKDLFRGFILCSGEDRIASACILPTGTIDDLSDLM
jgi:8-oxo-dGTP diphosphatase